MRACLPRLAAALVATAALSAACEGEGVRAPFSPDGGGEGGERRTDARAVDGRADGRAGPPGALDGSSGGPTQDATTGDAKIGDASPAPPTPASEELYDPDRIPRFDLELSPAAAAALNKDPKQYVRGVFRYGGETVNDVGIRRKGEATLRDLSEKAPFKIKFDAFVPGQTFRGLRRMTLNNLTEDASFLAERLSYHVFRAAKLPAPRANNALVYVNGALYGLYANIETEDKTFLRRWFGSDGGNLYEEGQKDFLPGNEATFELETNEARNDRSDLRALIAAVAAPSDATFVADLDRHLDMTHFLRFTAVELIVNQWDMYGYTRFYPNNFRLYHDPTSTKFVFLPWGMDMSLKDFRGLGDHMGVFEVARRYNARNGPVTAGLIFQRCLKNAGCKATYTMHLRELLALFEGLMLDKLAERYYAQVKAHVYADPRKEVSNQEFERGYATVVRIIRERAARIRAEIGN